MFRGTHRQTHEDVAIKEIDFSHPGAVRELRLRREAEAEITLLLRIKHLVHDPTIMVLKEAFLDEARKRFYLVMPMCKGGELFDYVANVRAVWARAGVRSWGSKVSS